MPADPTYLLIQTQADLATVAVAVSESRWVGLDCETTGLDPRVDRIRLIALNCETNSGGRFTYLIDLFRVDPSPLWEVLRDVELIAHNAAFDLGFLARVGFDAGRVHDTMILSQVYYASARMLGSAPLRFGLKDCVERELQVHLDKELQTSNWTGTLSAEQFAYAANDADVLVPLYQKLQSKLAKASLSQAAEIESATIPAIVWMSSAGVPFDSRQWKLLAAMACADCERLLRELEAAAPANTKGLFGEEWNWDSPEQVKEVLALAGCPVEATGDAVLAGLDHPLAQLLRDYRDARKRETTYGEAWLKHVASDGRVYPRWVQLGANSGRMACGSPNMQNLPRGDYRKCVAAAPGRILVKADYSQIELRIAAKISGDAALLAAYRRGDDLHVLTARNVLGIAEVTKQHRQLAKAVNFGLLYGMGARAFRVYAKTNYGVALNEREAEEYRAAFFRAYPGLRRWHRSVGNRSVDTRTLSGRRVSGVERFSEKLNLPVQGTGADGLKQALALLWHRRGDCPDAVPVLAVHDEIVVECSERDVEPVRTWLRRAMLDAMASLVEPIPIEVEVSVGRTWAGE